LVALLAFLGGAVGGDMLRGTGPDGSGADPAAATGGTGTGTNTGKPAEEDMAELDWFRFPNQFFVPILRNGTLSAVMILSLSIEMPAAARERIEAQEHRLRDALLNALMIEANTGAFDGNFTSEPALQRLRDALLAAGQKAAGPDVRRILIEDIGQQIQ